MRGAHVPVTVVPAPAKLSEASECSAVEGEPISTG